MNTPDRVADGYALLVDTFQRLGLTINYEKSFVEPTPNKEYIGYVLQTINNDGKVWVHVPSSRIRKVRRDIKKVVTNGLA